MFRLTSLTGLTVETRGGLRGAPHPSLMRLGSTRQTLSTPSISRPTLAAKSLTHHRPWSTQPHHQHEPGNPAVRSDAPPTMPPPPNPSNRHVNESSWPEPDLFTWDRAHRWMRQTCTTVKASWDEYPDQHIRLNHAITSPHPHSRVSNLEYRSLLQKYIKTHDDECKTFRAWCIGSLVFGVLINASLVFFIIPGVFAAASWAHYVRRNQVQAKLLHYDDDYATAHPPPTH
jgi:hypothetical protein